MNTAEAKAATNSPTHVPNTNPVWFRHPCVLEPCTIYDLEHNLKPTDVTNHYSGYPITKLGAELWTCYGKGGLEEITADNGTKFRFSPSRRAGRCCVEEGQIPTIYFWNL